MMKNWLIAAVLLATPLDVPAAIYKCTNAAGKTIFQQQPCPTGTTSAPVSAVQHQWVRVNSDNGVELHLDIGDIRKNGNTRRAYFKSVYLNPGQPPTEQAPYYQDFDCATGAVSVPVTSRAAQAGVNSNDPSYWLSRSDLFYQLPWVIDATKTICSGPAASAPATPSGGPNQSSTIQRTLGKEDAQRYRRILDDFGVTYTVQTNGPGSYVFNIERKEFESRRADYELIEREFERSQRER